MEYPISEPTTAAMTAVTPTATTLSSPVPA